MLRAGTLRDLITLLAFVPSTDERWGNVPGWVSFAQAWANVVPLTGTQQGTETFDANGVQSQTCYTVTMRYRPDLDSKCRIQYREQTLEIVSVADPEGRKRELLVQARAYTGVE
jgi:SPP1 family predicted phage head-tail adaptor